MVEQKFYIGNYKEDAKKDRGWFIGHFIEDEIRKTTQLEIKYWEFEKEQDSGHLLKVQRNATEYTFILEGEIVGRVEDKVVDLKKEDYIIIKPGVVNNLVEKVIEKAKGITIKVPSIGNDTVKIKKEFYG